MEVYVHFPVLLRSLVVACIVAILARPQSVKSKEKISSEGIDIVLAIDISTSMLARDFKPDRFEAAKEMAQEFIEGRVNDRIGLVVFAGESFTQCPITVDHTVLTEALDNLKMGLIEDGTALGMGLITAVDRLSESDAKSKVVILLTDGVNNRGEIEPELAAQSAKQLGIRVYTIGIGTNGFAPYPAKSPFGGTWMQKMKVEIDEELLEKIAETTGVDYFRATDNNKLKEIFARIDELETTRVEVASFRKYKEEFSPFAILAGCFFLLELLFRFIFIRKTP